MGEARKLLAKGKIVSGKVLFFWRKDVCGGVFDSDYFTSADQELPD